MISAPVPLPRSSASEPPAPTFTLVAVSGPFPCNAKEAVAPVLPSTTSAPIETASDPPVTETLEFDGGTIVTLAPVTGGAVPATFETFRPVICRPAGS